MSTVVEQVAYLLGLGGKVSHEQVKWVKEFINQIWQIREELNINNEGLGKQRESK